MKKTKWLLTILFFAGACIHGKAQTEIESYWLDEAKEFILNSDSNYAKEPLAYGAYFKIIDGRFHFILTQKTALTGEDTLGDIELGDKIPPETGDGSFFLKTPPKTILSDKASGLFRVRAARVLWKIPMDKERVFEINQNWAKDKVHYKAMLVKNAGGLFMHIERKGEGSGSYAVVAKVQLRDKIRPS